MKILAWYMFIVSILTIIASIAKDDKPSWRIFGVVLFMPFIIFLVKYLF